MFDVGFTEILLIGIVSLVVIGPERLPAVAKTAGQWIGKLQRFVKGVKTDLASEIESGDLKKLIGDQREQIDELRNMVSSAKKDFQSTTQSVVKSTREGLTELETSVKEAKADIAEAGNTPGQDTDSSTDKAPGKHDVAAIEKPSVKQVENRSRSKSTESGIDGLSAGDEPLSDQSTTIDPPSAKRTGTTDLDSQ